STSYTATYSMKIKTNAGTEIAGPNIEVKPNAIDNNIGNKAYGIFVGSPASGIGPYCVKDAEDVNNALVGNSCFSWQQSELLKTESDASDTKVISLLESMANAMDDNSTFIFYYSGHGGPNSLAVTGYLTASELETYLQKMPEKSHKILLIDACSSGSFLPKNLKKSTKTFKSLASSIQNLAVISACGPENDSSVSTGLDQSEMTYALLEGLGRKKDSVGISYVNNNTGLTLSELYNYMAVQDYYTALDDDYGTQDIFPTFRKTGNDFYIKKNK
ncbi:caspase family protein, partial [bacterium]|nr:caspase family protein [bacterium]